MCRLLHLSFVCQRNYHKQAPTCWCTKTWDSATACSEFILLLLLCARCFSLSTAVRFADHCLRALCASR